MHYCALLVTDKLPTEREIGEYLKPYNWDTMSVEEDEDGNLPEDFVYPTFTWDWYQVGGRYKGMLHLDCSTKYDDYYKWGFYVSDPRNGRLFISKLLDELEEYKKATGYPFFSEEDYFNYMGFEDYKMYLEGVKLSHLLNKDNLGCYICIRPDGSAIARETWNGKEFIKNANFDEQFRQILDENEDGFVTVLDLHD